MKPYEDNCDATDMAPIGYTMGQPEAQEIMYVLTDAAEALRDAIKNLDLAYSAILEKKRKLFYEFPTIDIHKRHKQ